MANKELLLNFYGVTVQVESQIDQVLPNLSRDFHYFRSRMHCRAQLRIRLHPASYRTGWWIQWLRTKRSRKFLAGKGEQRVCFFDQAWVRYRYRAGKVEIYCDNFQIAYEACFLIILSYIGEALDDQGWHRLHGWGFGFSNISGVVLGRSGMGKSTLALGCLLEEKRMKIFSDDTPMLRSQARMYAFPQRIALRESPPSAVPKRWVSQFHRFGHQSKFVISSEYFEKQVEKESKLNWLIATKRTEGKSKVVILSRKRMLWPVIKWLVIGYETPQIWELYLRFSVRDFVRKAKILGSRFRLAKQLLTRCQFAALHLSKDPREDRKVFLEFLEKSYA